MFLCSFLSNSLSTFSLLVLLDHLGSPAEPIKEARQPGSPLSFFSSPKLKGWNWRVIYFFKK